MPKEGCIKNQFVQGGNGLDFVEEIGGGILFPHHMLDASGLGIPFVQADGHRFLANIAH